MKIRKLEAAVILMSVLGCKDNFSDNKNLEFLVRDEIYQSNIQYLRELNSYNIHIGFDDLSGSERDRLVMMYLRDRISGCYYNFKSWMRNIMDNITK